MVDKIEVGTYSSMFDEHLNASHDWMVQRKHLCLVLVRADVRVYPQAWTVTLNFPHLSPNIDIFFIAISSCLGEI